MKSHMETNEEKSIKDKLQVKKVKEKKLEPVVKKGKNRASEKIRIFGHNFVSDPASGSSSSSSVMLDYFLSLCYNGCLNRRQP